jgi:hypothetical protein
MKFFLIAILMHFSVVFAEYSIVFIHVGDTVPPHADVAIAQARRFNPHARIILLSSEKGLQRFRSLEGEENLQLCSYEDLPRTSIHQRYQNRCVETSPFWRYTSERFLYLWDLMKAYSLENVFHLENDNMLYADLEPLLPHFQHYYPGVGATFDNDERCIPGFVWIANCGAMEDLAAYFAKKAPLRLSDMQVMGLYRQERFAKAVDNLPIIMPQYSSAYPLKSSHNHATQRPSSYSNHSEIFQAIFDAAAIGQFLGGIDPIHANHEPGFINESCLFNPSLLEYKWELDEQGRAVPYAVFQGYSYKIINLHIHSKRLQEFKSGSFS